LKVVVGLRGLSKNVNRYFCKNEGVWLCAGQKEAYDAILLQVALKTAFRAATARRRTHHAPAQVQLNNDPSFGPALLE
jgi:hypothetical protein